MYSATVNSSPQPARAGSRTSPRHVPMTWPVSGPLWTLLILTLAFRYTRLDLAISSLFYDSSTQSWSWFSWTPCTLLYRWGVYPPFAMAVIGGGLFLAGLSGFWRRNSEQLARSGLFLLLMLAIGPGVIVNLGLKTYWGRARPNEVQEFGGRFHYSPVGSPGEMTNRNSSFPSGHAALAFSLMAPGFVLRQRRWSELCFALGTLYGLAMSLARIAQGGHFASDALWSGGIVYLVGVVLARLLLQEGWEEAEYARLDHLALGDVGRSLPLPPLQAGSPTETLPANTPAPEETPVAINARR